MWRNKPGQGEKGREEFAREAMAHLDHLYRVAIHLAKEPDQAEDLVQETYARALGSYEQFAPGTHLKSWLTKILHNLFFDRYREAKRWVAVEDMAVRQNEEINCWEKIPAENPGPHGEVLHKELNVKISEALKQLPEEFRMAIILVDMGDFSYSEAAEILSCPLGTVRSRLSRGRRILYQQLKAYVGAKEKA